MKFTEEGWLIPNLLALIMRQQKNLINREKIAITSEQKCSGSYAVVMPSCGQCQQFLILVDINKLYKITTGYQVFTKFLRNYYQRASFKILFY